MEFAVGVLTGICVGSSVVRVWFAFERRLMDERHRELMNSINRVYASGPLQWGTTGTSTTITELQQPPRGYEVWCQN